MLRVAMTIYGMGKRGGKVAWGEKNLMDHPEEGIVDFA